MSAGQVVTFYSFKGGVGRTMALANVAWLAAKYGKRVLCIDWDLEAPGLDHYLRVTDHRKNSHGLVDLIEAVAAGQNPDWRSFVRSVPSDGKLDIIHAGHSDDYLRRMQRLDWDGLYERVDLGGLIEAWRAEWLVAYDLVLIDSRTGVTDVGSICAAQLPDILVLVVNPNHQALDGGLEVVAAAGRARGRMVYDREPLLVLPVISRLEMRVEYRRSESWFQLLDEGLGPLTDPWRHASLTTRDLLLQLRIPYIPYWSFGEELAVKSHGTADSEDVGYAYDTLAALLILGLADSQDLIRDRGNYLYRAGARPKFDEQVHILHGKAGAEFAARLVSMLRARGVLASTSDEDWEEQPGIPWVQRAQHFVAVVGGDPSSRLLSDVRTARTVLEVDSVQRRLLFVALAETDGAGVNGPEATLHTQDPRVAVDWVTTQLGLKVVEASEPDAALELPGWLETVERALKAQTRTRVVSTEAVEEMQAFKASMEKLTSARPDGNPAALRLWLERVAGELTSYSFRFEGRSKDMVASLKPTMDMLEILLEPAMRPILLNEHSRLPLARVSFQEVVAQVRVIKAEVATVPPLTSRIRRASRRLHDALDRIEIVARGVLTTLDRLDFLAAEVPEALP